MATLTEHLNTITIMELVTLLFRLASVKNQPLSFQIFFSNDPVNNIKSQTMSWRERERERERAYVA